MVQKTKYYSLVTYCTSDVNHIEELTLFGSTDPDNINIRGHFLCVILVEAITG